jgi:hypothetical protein
MHDIDHAMGAADGYVVQTLKSGHWLWWTAYSRADEFIFEPNE